MRATKTLLMCACLIAAWTAAAGAQGSKPAVAILPISTTLDAGDDLYAARAFEGLLAQTMDGLGRVTVIDRTQADRVSMERETQKTLDFIDSESLAAQGQSLGAELVITANIDKLASTVERLSDGSASYKANMSVTVRLIDVSTQEVMNSATITSDASSGGKKGLGGLLRSVVSQHTTAEDAITAAVKNATPELEAFFGEAFPVRFTLVSVESISKDSNQATFLMDGGKNLGAQKKQKLAVIELSELEIGGRTVVREKELGEIEITDLEGDELSLGKMKSDARLVAQRMASGVAIYAVVR